MVLYETDVTDRQYNFDEIFSHLGECKLTIYTGKTYHCVGATYNKIAGVYFIETAKGEELKFKKSAVVYVEKI